HNFQASGGRHIVRLFGCGLDREGAGLIAIFAQLGGAEVDVVNVIGSGAKHRREQGLEFGDIAKKYLQSLSDFVIIDERTVLAVIAEAYVDVFCLSVAGIYLKLADGGHYAAHDSIVLGNCAIESLVSGFHAKVQSDAVGSDVDGGIAGDIDAMGVRKKLGVDECYCKQEQSGTEFHGEPHLG